MDLTEITIVAIGGFCLFVVMPAIIAFSSYQEKKLKVQQEIAKAGGVELQNELSQTRVELKRLQDRMAVIERLLTDDDRRLAGDIERLRREPVTPAA